MPRSVRMPVVVPELPVHERLDPKIFEGLHEGGSRYASDAERKASLLLRLNAIALLSHHPQGLTHGQFYSQLWPHVLTGRSAHPKADSIHAKLQQAFAQGLIRSPIPSFEEANGNIAFRAVASRPHAHAAYVFKQPLLAVLHTLKHANRIVDADGVVRVHPAFLHEPVVDFREGQPEKTKWRGKGFGRGPGS